MQQIPGGQQPTADTYPSPQGSGPSLGPDLMATGLILSVYNVTADVKLILRDEGSPQGYQYGDEFAMSPNAQVFPKAIGFAAKSHVPGTPALIQATLWSAVDGPLPSSPVPITATLSPSGIVTPPVANVNFQHNDVFVAAEPTIDFEDGNGTRWTLTDDGANTRVKVAQMTAGSELAASQATALLLVTAASEATAQLVCPTLATLTLDGATTILIDVFAPRADVPAAAIGSVRSVIFDSFNGGAATSLGIIADYESDAGGNAFGSHVGQLHYTPAAGTHAYSWRAWAPVGASGGRLIAGAGGPGAFLPMFIRATLAA